MKVILFILSFIWQLPQSLIGGSMVLFYKVFGKIEKISYKKLCFAYKSPSMIGGVSLGNFAILSEQNGNKPAYVAHEQEGHTFDSHIFGPLYLFVIGIPSALFCFFSKKCYYDFYTERWANKHAKLEVEYHDNRPCTLKFKNE